jgi:hypothetical protein
LINLIAFVGGVDGIEICDGYTHHMSNSSLQSVKRVLLQGNWTNEIVPLFPFLETLFLFMLGCGRIFLWMHPRCPYERR